MRVEGVRRVPNRDKLISQIREKQVAISQPERN